MNKQIVSLGFFFSGLLVAGACIFSAVRPVHARAINNEVVVPVAQNQLTVIDLEEVKIEASEVASSRAKVTILTSKKTFKTTVKKERCWIHELEQQGSPIARTVKVCE